MAPGLSQARAKSYIRKSSTFRCGSRIAMASGLSHKCAKQIYQKKLQILLCSLIVFTIPSIWLMWSTLADVLEVREPDLHLERFVGNVKSRLANPDHALGDGDLRVAFSAVNADIVEWKLKLVREAWHSVLFADVMCGQVLDLLCDVLQAKLSNHSHFQVVLLRYAREDCYGTHVGLENLAAAYPQRVHYFHLTQDNYDHMWPGSNKVHIKSVVVDYGKYFTLGGSVWVDYVLYNDRDSDFFFEDCSGTIGAALWNDLIGASASFVHEFSDKYKAHAVDIGHLSRMVELKTYKLCAKHAINACGFPYHCSSFKNFSIPIPKPDIYFSGPGQKHNNGFVDAMVEAITNSKSRIVMSHKYFILPERLKLALTNAAARGVRILIVTQGETKEGNTLRDLAAQGIGAANDIQAIGILASGQNVKVYKFIGRSKLSLTKSYHQKVVIADDLFFAGSANMGPKSMSEFVDLEVTFRVHSKALSDEYENLTLMYAETYCAGLYGVSPLQWALAYVWHVIRYFTTFANY